MEAIERSSGEEKGVAALWHERATREGKRRGSGAEREQQQHLGGDPACLAQRQTAAAGKDKATATEIEKEENKTVRPTFINAGAAWQQQG